MQDPAPPSVSSTSASVSASPQTIPASSVPPLPPGVCPAATTKAPPNGFEADDGVVGPTELPIGDLDGDGVPEIVVSFPASYTERGLLVMKKVAAPACFTLLYEGVGEGAGRRKTKTRGFSDLSILMVPITSHGRGSAMAIATYDGKRYHLDRVEKCAGTDGKQLPASACNGILAGYDDAAKGGAR